ncbi:MAG: hypothetical protein ACK4YP_15770 [Myxococcota bacterium]
MANDAEDHDLDSAHGGVKLHKAEARVLARLKRARIVADLAAPDVTPTLEDLIELAEMIEEEGG